MSRLYIHDHCPLSIRTLLVAHYRRVGELERVVLAADDEESGRRLGCRQLPIFEHQGVTIGDSMAIARLLDELGEPGQLLRPLALREAILPQLQPVQASLQALIAPRLEQAGCDSLASAEARASFRRQQEAQLGITFAQARAQTAHHRARVEPVLAALPPLTLPSSRHHTLSWNDVLNFPLLYGLSLVESLTLPAWLRQWLLEVARLGGVMLYFDRAS